jgi:heme exporter protein B
LGSVVADTLRFGGLALAFSVGVGLLFTVVSAIASKTKAGGIIMPLLSFPLIIPMILVTVTAGVFTVTGDYTDYTQNIAVITLINLMVTVIGTVVFRFLWQE